MNKYELILGVNISGGDRSNYEHIFKKIGVEKDGSWEEFAGESFDRYYGDRGYGISGSVVETERFDNQPDLPVDYWYGDCDGDPEEDESGINFEALSSRKKNALLAAIKKDLPLYFSVPAYGGSSSVHLFKDSTAMTLGLGSRHNRWW